MIFGHFNNTTCFVVFLAHALPLDFSPYSWLYCTRWCSVFVLFSWWRCHSTATRSTLWLALPLPYLAFLSTSWVSTYQSPNDHLSSPSYCVSFPHTGHPKAHLSLQPPSFFGLTQQCRLNGFVVVSYCRFYDSLHPVHLLLCTDRDGQKRIASSTL